MEDLANSLRSSGIKVKIKKGKIAVRLDGLSNPVSIIKDISADEYKVKTNDSVYTQWRDGAIRGIMAISCKTKLTKQRTHDLWENFLTYMDSTPPVLPEPSVE